MNRSDWIHSEIRHPKIGQVWSWGEVKLNVTGFDEEGDVVTYWKNGEMDVYVSVSYHKFMKFFTWVSDE